MDVKKEQLNVNGEALKHKIVATGDVRSEIMQLALCVQISSQGGFYFLLSVLFISAGEDTMQSPACRCEGPARTAVSERIAPAPGIKEK